MSAPARAAARRLFLALWPSTAQRQALLRATADLVRASGASAVPAQNLHVTLAFLGAVPEERTAELAALAAEVAAAQSSDSVQLRLDRLEYWCGAQILAAIDGTHCGSATVLAGGLRRAALAAGFRPDLKPFHAHVTVARKVNAATAPAQLPAVPWKCETLALLESRGGESGPVYSVLDLQLLGKREKMRR